MKMCIGFVVVALATLPASAGVLYEVESTFSGTSSTTGIAVEGMRMKMNMATGRADWNGDMLFFGDSREMIVIDHDKKSYYVIDQEQLDKLASSINQAMSSMEQALAALPEGQRAKMEQMMKSRMPSMAEPREPSELKKTGAADTVNGYDCEIYEVWRSGVRERELCITDWGNVAGGEEVAGIFHEMGEFMAEMLDNMPKMSDGRSFGDAAFEHLKETNGFPVRTREYGDDGMLDGQSTLLSSKEVDFDTGDFAPPEKYKRMDLMKGMN